VGLLVGGRPTAQPPHLEPARDPGKAENRVGDGLAVRTKPQAPRSLPRWRLSQLWKLEEKGVRDIEVESGGAASLPVVLELAIEMAASECNDSVGPADGPEHAGLLEA
jgi:hypothetical protein